MQQVPAVQIDGITLSQSLMIQYIEETRTGHRLLPADPKKRNLYVLQKMGAEKVQWAHHFIPKKIALHTIPPIWKETAGKYCVGDEISMADICLIPQVYNAELDVDQFPTIKRLNQTLLKVDAFKESHPSCQLDTPAEICT
uniref:Glutathione S-transferase zeta 1 n=1 Tax=Salmo trutta TaxID=8032 RepID=A0A673X5J8_SALTR